MQLTGRCTPGTNSTSHSVHRIIDRRRMKARVARMSLLQEYVTTSASAVSLDVVTLQDSRLRECWANRALQ